MPTSKNKKLGTNGTERLLVVEQLKDSDRQIYSSLGGYFQADKYS
ncbi:hypothetical protein [Spirosoma foliorum]|nr:hypothetical protein [Spirosoma foliorum]